MLLYIVTQAECDVGKGSRQLAPPHKQNQCYSAIYAAFARSDAAARLIESRGTLQSATDTELEAIEEGNELLLRLLIYYFL